jgi:broad specificity phosphatase PhoE
MSEYGDSAIELVEEVRSLGVNHMVLLMRHSAREFEPGRHDLENPLTDEGRSLAQRFGEKLPKELRIRGYASPVERCLETADFILKGHSEKGGESTRVRPVEALGVFYVLDQQKMFKSMQSLNAGHHRFMDHWYDGQVPLDIMMPARIAANTVADLAREKIRHPISDNQLDIMVSHDMTLYTIKDQILGQNFDSHGEVEFLDGVIFYQLDGQPFIKSHQGAEILLDRFD